METDHVPFWKYKSLNEMSRAEWESLCDGCARCCLHKLENKNTGKIYYTHIACRFLDIPNCKCRIYNDPYAAPEGCRKITPENIKEFSWLPDTCGYRLVFENKELKWWHPLVSGDPATVHDAGISVCRIAVSEEYVHPDDFQSFLI